MPAPEHTDLEKVIETAGMAHRIFTRALNASISTDSTTGSCAFACYFLKHLFDRFTNFESDYRGGDGNGDGGYRDYQGNCHGHYWLEVRTTLDHYIVDITADQFGDKTIVVLPLSANQRYFAGCQKTVNEHFKDF